MTREEEQELVKKAKESLDEFVILYRYFYPKIFAFVVAKVVNRQDAEDITALTFEKALRSLKGYDEKKSLFTTWLHNIASNNVIDFYRERGKLPTASIEDAQWLPSEAAQKELVDIQWYQSLMECIMQLPESKQDILVMRLIVELPDKEIMDVLGCSQQTYSMRLLRALRALWKVAEKERLFEGTISLEGS